MPTYNFTFLFDAPELLNEEILDRLFEAGCGDALFGERDGIQFAEFDRESSSLEESLLSAIDDMHSVLPDIHLVRVEPNDLASLTILAERLKRSKEYVRLLFLGKRGPGGFPKPAVHVDERTRLWRWVEVAEWVSAHPELGMPVNLEDARTFALLNGLLEQGHYYYPLWENLADAPSQRARLMDFFLQDEVRTHTFSPSFVEEALALERAKTSHSSQVRLIVWHAVVFPRGGERRLMIEYAPLTKVNQTYPPYRLLMELLEQAKALLKTKGHPFVATEANDKGLLGHCYNCAREVRLEAGQLVGDAVETVCPQPAWL